MIMTMRFSITALLFSAAAITIPNAVFGFAPSTSSSSSTTTSRSIPLTRHAATDDGSGNPTVSGPPYSGPTVKPILDSVNYPSDMKGLDMRQLKQLANELRWEVLEQVSKTGGHLSSSLGVTELTVALHYVFDMPDDDIIWDVAHQCYPHKILTGRRDQFPTLRQLGGISGFCKRKESKYDSFGAGHSSTSISAAQGMSIAKSVLNKRKNNCVAVIGDGAITGGMA